MARSYPQNQALSWRFLIGAYMAGPYMAWTVAGLAVCAMLAVSLPATAQVMTVSTVATGPAIDRRYTQIEPTHVDLPQTRIDARGHQDILRTLYAEQGFAMRPLPRGKHGLTLQANGKLTPAGEGYLNEVTVYGLSVKAGERVVLSNLRIDKDRIIFDINGGPMHKHEFMRHVQIGVGGPNMTEPVIQDANDPEPTGARIVLTFKDYVPEVTPAQIKALLAPLISFDMKTPVQAFTDTLPPSLKKAILDHHVMVGMSTEMVLYAMGAPDAKSREMDGQMPFEEWIYGKPPQDVNFVRINGNRVIRVEVAKLGQPLAIFTKDEVEGLLMTDGRPVMAQVTQTREKTIQMGDAHRDDDTQAPSAPPTLRGPGERLPQDKDSNDGVGDKTINREGPLRPVVFPKDTSNDPARTVPAHPKPAAPPDDKTAADGSAKPADGKSAAAKPAADKSAPDKSAPDKSNQAKPAPDQPAVDSGPKPDAQPAPAKPQPPSYFYGDHPQPAGR